MTKVTKELIDKYAEKLYFELSKEENDKLLAEFAIIEARMNLISSIPNINNYEPMSHPFELENVSLREDIANSSLKLDDAFSNCNHVNGREIEIPRMVE